MIRGWERGNPSSTRPAAGPTHVFWFGGLCFVTAVWSDEPRTIEYVGDDEGYARATAEAIEKDQAALVESCLRRIMKRIDGGGRGEV